MRRQLLIGLICSINAFSLTTYAGDDGVLISSFDPILCGASCNQGACSSPCEEQSAKSTRSKKFEKLRKEIRSFRSHNDIGRVLDKSLRKFDQTNPELSTKKSVSEKVDMIDQALKAHECR